MKPWVAKAVSSSFVYRGRIVFWITAEWSLKYCSMISPIFQLSSRDEGGVALQSVCTCICQCRGGGEQVLLICTTTLLENQGTVNSTQLASNFVGFHYAKTFKAFQSAQNSACVNSLVFSCRKVLQRLWYSPPRRTNIFFLQTSE